jgi:hypothetical protein
LDTTLAFAAPAPETLRAEPVTTVPQKRFFNFRMNSKK